MPTVSIILVNYNERDYLHDVIRLVSVDLPDAEIVVVDNASHDGSAAMVRQQFPNVVVIESPDNLMYGRGNNLGFQQAHGEWLLVLNPDVTWEQGQLRRLIDEAATRPDIALAGPRVQSRNGRLQFTAHRNFPNWLTIFLEYCLPVQQLALRLPFHPYVFSERGHRRTQSVAHLTGMCLLVRRSVIEAIGGFDPEFTMYLEETEWQKRMADHGFQRWFISEATITHFGSAEKNLAQASPNFFWGLRVYTKKHWSPTGRTVRLLTALWTATVVSDILLGLLYIPSYILGRAGRRIRHYAKVYIRLTLNLIRFSLQPNRRP